MTRDQLIAFEQRVADAFAAKQIRAPIHLSSPSQADHLIEIFADFRPGVDWLCSNWRNHMHCLLAGWPEEELFAAILDGRSMFPCSAKYRTVCSAIVGGVLPIACGLAMGILRNLVEAAEHVLPDEWGAPARVWVCVGDMTASTGLFHEFQQFCKGHELPIRIVIEDNGRSTNADTEATWGHGAKPLRIDRYSYERTWPHCGMGTHVAF